MSGSIGAIEARDRVRSGMIICGIDPGLSGALAFFEPSTGEVETIDMPTLKLGKTGKRRIDEHQLADILWKRHAGHAFVEQSWPRPNDSGPGGFSVGVGFGVIRGILAAVGLPFTIVSPQKWKAALGVTGDKDNSRSRASQLLPQASGQWSLKKHDGRAEAALIAWYGARKFAAIADTEKASAVALAAAEG